MSDVPAGQPIETAAGWAKGPWLVRCVRGLFRVTVDELKYRKILPSGAEPLVLRQRNYDLLFIQRATRPPTCATIRTAEEILRCIIYGRYKISKAQLDLLSKELTARHEGYQIAVSVEGTHFVRADVRRYLERELTSRGVKIDPESPGTLFVFCVDAAYYLGTIWSRENEAEFRRSRVSERPGSLPPTIAAAMAFSGRIEPGATVLDPVCGSGTLLAEAGGYCRDVTLIGLDVDPAAIESARKNLADFPNVQLKCEDSTTSSLPAQSIQIFLANLPFGKQFGDRKTNRELYRRLAREIVRLGAPGKWRAVLLTSDDEAIQAALAINPGLAIKKTLRLQVKGEEAKMYLVQSRDKDSGQTNGSDFG